MPAHRYRTECFSADDDDDDAYMVWWVDCDEECDECRDSIKLTACDIVKGGCDEIDEDTHVRLVVGDEVELCWDDPIEEVCDRGRSGNFLVLALSVALVLVCIVLCIVLGLVARWTRSRPQGAQHLQEPQIVYVQSPAQQHVVMDGVPMMFQPTHQGGAAAPPIAKATRVG